MPTILELITLTTDYFDKKGISSSRINAELLLADILKCKRLDLYLSFDKPLEDSEVNQYREYVRRRAKFEPLQYIIGNVEFYGLEFIVNKDVLIPRQETEILVEAVINEIKKSGYSTALDIGTGSGIIPVCVSHKIENIVFDAIDISNEAIEVAKQNANKNKVNEQIVFSKNDILLSNELQKKYDLIISNPPYVSASEYNSLQKEIVEFEPQAAVTDYSDGYTFYRAISIIAAKSLNENGSLFFEVGKDQFLMVSEIMRSCGFNHIEIIKDYLNIERVIKGKL
jgi:release factor glutamine methyltransferase